MKDNKIDFELYTAGEYKRTVTMFGENNEEGKAKFEELLGDLIFKPPGKPTLVPNSDKRPAINVADAKKEFNEIMED